MNQGYVPNSLHCPRCGSQNVQVSMTQAAASTRTRGRGCLWTLMRWALIIGTFGLWLFIGKSKGKSKTKFVSKKVAICQSCGNNWDA